ncbi:MAG: glycosyl hydrolase family 18 protein [Bacteroidota bacterium]
MYPTHCFRLVLINILALSLQPVLGFSQAQDRDTLSISAELKSDTIEWQRKREIPSQGVLQEFKVLFATLYGDSNKVTFKGVKDLKEIVYDSTAKVYQGRYRNDPGLQEGIEIMAWHPNWMTEAYKFYPYHLLSTIAFFSYDVNPEDGTYRGTDAIDAWKTTGLIDSARQHDVKVLLTLSCYGEKNNDVLLKNNNNSWQRLSDSVRFLIRKKEAQGIDIDFSGIRPSMRDEFSNFVYGLRSKLGDSAIITLQIPYNADHSAYDIEKLKAWVNNFIIKGYATGNSSSAPVPSASISSVSSMAYESLEGIVNKLICQGLSAGNIIISMPMYGALWGVSDPEEVFEKYIPYEDIIAQYSLMDNDNTYEIGNSAVITIGESAEQKEIWYEKVESLNKKYRWAKAERLGGVGLWGPGYGGVDSDIWNGVKETFGKSPLIPLQAMDYDGGPAYGITYSLQRYRKIIGVTLAITICFFIIGVLLSFLDWRVREVFFRNDAYRGILAAGMILATAFVVFLLSDSKTEDRWFTGFVYGVLAGGSVVYVVSTIYLRHRKKLK